MSRVVLAMSGGVDSSVAAHLLCEQGHEVIGVFMRHGEESPVACNVSTGAGGKAVQLPVLSSRPDHKQGCCTASDAEDARRVADRLDIPFYALNLQQEFQQIIDYFVAEYTRARTPNPCVMCNNWIKFGKLFDYADSVGAEFVATGHYARIEQDEHGRPALLRGIDSRKDQSYVLFGVNKEYLSRMLLPVGGFEKPEIRRLAEQTGLRVADKADSQEICFVTRGKHDAFVRGKSGTNTAGELVTTSGEVVGRHGGIESFTVGQRKGIGLAFGEPHFVVRIEPETHRVVVGPKSALGRNELFASDTNWLTDDLPRGPFPCLAQIRYNSSASSAVCEILPDNRLHITFDEPAEGIAPGQAVVCYHENRVLGGGWIE